MSTPAQTTPSAQVYPQQITVSYSLVITVNDQDERDYWLESGTNNPNPESIADIFDDDENCTIVSINSLDRVAVAAILAAKQP